ncbi:MAG: caspase family protein [Myxococcaceae bacterium]
MTAALLTLMLLGATAEPARVLISIGNDVGDPGDALLKFAEKDAERVAELLRELGSVAPADALLVLGADADGVRVALGALTRRVQAHRSKDRPVVLIAYVSAHAAAGALHLKGTHLPLEELKVFLASSGAAVRILVVDACEAGTVVSRKGGAAAPAYDVRLEPLQLEGQVVITSAGPAESAEEWDALAGSLFTHHLLTALRGSADLEGDGRVTLAEAYAYAHRRTIAQSARGLQHPAFDFDLSGTGELVLSRPNTATSAVVFPAGMEGNFVIASAPSPEIVAEVDKRAGRPLRLAVPPGRYLLRKHMGHRVAVVELELPFGGERVVDEEAMTVRHFSEVALKGGSLELHPWGAMAVGAVASAPIEGTAARWAAGLGVRRTSGSSWISAQLNFGATGYHAVGLTTGENLFAAELGAGYRLQWNPLVPYAGVAVGAGLHRQWYTRDSEEDIRRITGAGALPSRSTLALSFGPVVGIEVPLPARAFALVEAQLQVRRLPADSQPEWTLGGLGRTAVGVRF